MNKNQYISFSHSLTHILSLPLSPSPSLSCIALDSFFGKVLRAFNTAPLGKRKNEINEK